MNKLVVCIMGQDCKDFAEIALKSVEGADAIVFCDGGSKPEFMSWLKDQGFASVFDFSTFPLLLNNENKLLIQQEFKQDDPQMNGKQRNLYLEFLKQHYAGWWCLCIDADEVVHDLEKLKKWCAEQVPEIADQSLYSVHMRHLFYDFAHEDNSQPRHYVPNRLFLVRDCLKYPLGEHSPLGSTTQLRGLSCDATTIWHLAYAPIFHIRSRYRKNLKHSVAHSRQFLERWYRAHLFGEYPVSRVEKKDLPRALLEGFDIDPDELYFEDRGIETKHFIDAGHWRDHFQLTKNDVVIEWGCGLGPRVAALWVAGVKAVGVELSNWAVNHTLTAGNVFQGDITMPFDKPFPDYKLSIAYDLLEHIPYDKLDIAIENLKATSRRYILVSVPVLGDPNLEADSTHIIKESKDWWRTKFMGHSLKELEVPHHFLYREQLMIWEVSFV